MDINLSVIKKEGGQVIRQVRHVEKSVPDYDLTNSKRDFSTAVFSVDLPIGKYNVKVMLEDKESRQRETVEKEVDLRAGTSGYFDISDIILSRSSEINQELNTPLHPNVSGIVPEPSSIMYCYFDIGRSNPEQVCKLFLYVNDKTGVIKHNDSLAIVGGEKLSSYFMSVPCKDLSFSHYSITLKAVCEGDTIQRNASFKINFHGLPWTISDIDQAIRQLKYIATTVEINRLAGQFPSNKEEAFIMFWKDHFPCQGDAVNGKMLEYYDRVNYTNIHFGGNRQGWETDRGRVLILYGKPNRIERNDEGISSEQYEIWYYNHLNKRFTFKDEFGFGEYRLVSSIW
ncbi:MAG: GWxTD domain-containing protein [Candidatus Hatepunaea meridiana]|nr:GWxTD domain-containing protein [Candidatus Hatepunaea meridiana]